MPRKMLPESTAYDSARGVYAPRESLRRRLFQLIAYSDTTPTRFFLALTATMWCVTLALPGDTFLHPVYYAMVAVTFGSVHSEEVWSGLWGILAAGMWWRTFSSTPAPRAAIAINALSVALYSVSTYSVLAYRLWPFPAMMVPGLACVAASAWILVRTHVNSENGWRID